MYLYIYIYASCVSIVVYCTYCMLVICVRLWTRSIFYFTEITCLNEVPLTYTFANRNKWYQIWSEKNVYYYYRVFLANIKKQSSSKTVCYLIGFPCSRHTHTHKKNEERPLKKLYSPTDTTVGYCFLKVEVWFSFRWWKWYKTDKTVEIAFKKINIWKKSSRSNHRYLSIYLSIQSTVYSYRGWVHAGRVYLYVSYCGLQIVKMTVRPFVAILPKPSKPGDEIIIKGKIKDGAQAWVLYLFFKFLLLLFLGWIIQIIWLYVICIVFL